MRTKREAIEAAKALKAKMKPGHWRTRVWKHVHPESGTHDWRYCIEAGPSETCIIVKPSIFPDQYITRLANAHELQWNPMHCYPNPQQAVIEHFILVQKLLDQLQEHIDTAAKAAGITDLHELVTET